MKHNHIPEVIKPYISMDVDKYKLLEPNLLQINSLFEDGILKNNLYKYFAEDFSDISFYLQMLRSEYTKKFGFFLISEDFISVTSELLQNNKVLEVGAGSGFLSYCLQKNGVDITPIDLKIDNNNYGFEQTYTEIIQINAVDYIKKNNNYDTIIMSWPNYQNPFAYNVLKQMKKGQQLIYIGEGYGGCTADDKFFKLLQDRAFINNDLTSKLKQNSYSWPCIHDEVESYIIK